MNAIGYIRVSTEAQAEDDKFGVEVQRKAILDYAKANDFVIVRWEQDNISGAKDKRPALDRILYGDVYNPPIDAVIAFKSDRIARDTKLYFYYLYTLEKKGVKLISTQEQFDDGDEFANIYRSLLLFVAEQERKNIALRTTQGRHVKAIGGGYAGGKAPYGYKIVNKKMEVVQEEAEVVQIIYGLHDAGANPMEIMRYLNDKGYKTRGGKEFRHTVIRSILANKKVYQGYYKYGNMDYVKGEHVPLIVE